MTDALAGGRTEARTGADAGPTSSAAVASLGAWLRARRVIDGDGLFVRPGGREELLERLRALGASPSSRRETDEPAGIERSGLDRAAIDRLATVGTAGQIESLESLDAVAAVAGGCVRCPLHESRRNVVFADGPSEARVMCVGEAPGRNEDETGVPFVGRAGNLLDQLLLSVGLPRREVYICNVLKCRPPQNRNPLPREIEKCSPFLRRQVALVAPEVIVAFGTFAARTLLNATGSLGSLRGRTHLFEGVPLVVTYHPAALLRNPGWKRPAWEDLQRVRHILEEGTGG